MTLHVLGRLASWVLVLWVLIWVLSPCLLWVLSHWLSPWLLWVLELWTHYGWWVLAVRLLVVLPLIVPRVLLVILLSLNALIRLVSRILSLVLLDGFPLTGIPIGCVCLPHPPIEELRDPRDLPEGV